MKIATEERPDGTKRFRIQHKDLEKPGRYTTRRFDNEDDAKDFVRRAKLELSAAIAWDEERRGGVSFRGQAGRTFIDYATDYVNAQTDVKQGTREAGHAQLRIIAQIDSFAALQMGAITRTDLENLKTSLSALPSRRGESLKSRTKNGLLRTVFAVIRHAAAVNDIPRDVTFRVKKFRVDDAKETCPITVPEFDSILIHVKPERRAIFRVLLDSGLRISEALALQWRDISETSQGIYQIAVWASDSQRGKTEKAQRITTIPADTFKLLTRDDETRVFTATYYALSNEWRNAVQRAQSGLHATEFPVLTKTPSIHDLRHTHAGFLLTTEGGNLALVAERLGHSDISVTQKYYGRLVTEQAHHLGVQIARSIPRGVVE